MPLCVISERSTVTYYNIRYANWRKRPDRFLEDVWSGVRAVSSREEVRRHVEWWAEYCARQGQLLLLLIKYFITN